MEVFALCKSFTLLYKVYIAWANDQKYYVDFIIPTLFLKKAKGILLSPLSVRPSVMLSPPKPLDEIQPNLVCELFTWMGRATHFFCHAPWGPGEGSNGPISFNFNYKVNFKDFISNFVCVLTNERYKTYQTGFFIQSPGSFPRGT